MKRIFNDREYRRKAIELISFIFSMLFGALNGVMHIITSSIWFLMLCIYYVALSFARGGIYLYKKKKDIKSKLKEIKIYRSSGIFLLVMNSALCVAVLQIIFIEKAFNYPGLFIYAAATYAFTKITFAIINISKTRGSKNYLEIALRSINLIDASVSILALQTALLSEFSAPGTDYRIANTLTGSAVILFTLSLGIFIIIKSQKEIKKSNEQQ